MTKVAKHKPVKGSKLVRLLSEYQLSDIETTYKNFAERLGTLIDLSDSVSLAESLRAIPKMSAPAGDASLKTTQDDHIVDVFLKHRSLVLNSILKSFDLSAVFVQLKLPVPKLDTPLNEASNFDQYQRFYLLHQSELDFKIEQLRAVVRKLIASRSLNLSQLAALDQTISKSMSGHTRKHFSIVPKILKIRFEQLYFEYCDNISSDEQKDNIASWLESDGWLTQFYAEMQQLLLAEFEVRLQPVIGLVEAYNEEIEKDI